MAREVGPDGPAMSDQSVPYLVRWAAKYGRSVLNGRITPKEFADTLHGHLGGSSPPEPAVVTDMVAALPREARPVMASALSAVLAPGFYHPYAFGFPMSDAERGVRQARSMALAREWAKALLAALTDDMPG
jgi:hypothetical protein